MTQYNLQQLNEALQSTMKQNDEGDMAALPMFKNPFITIVKNDRHQRIELHLRGYFESPQESTQQLTELYQLAESYPTVLVYINSGGGRVDLLMELHNALKKFDHVITVVNSDAASAGFMLWASGHVRVVCHHAELMIHRESSGSMGKTDQMIDRVDFMKRRFEKIFSMFCEDVLTEAEKERARLTEVWFTGDDMIERGAAISWDQFQERDTTPYNSLEIVERDGATYLRQGNYLTPVNVTPAEDAFYSLFDILYEVPDPVNLIEGKTLAEVAGFEEPDQPEEEEQKEEVVDKDLDSNLRLSKDKAREIMRDCFGKGNYRIYHPGVIVAIYKRKEHIVLDVGYGWKHTVGDLYEAIDALIEELKA